MGRVVHHYNGIAGNSLKWQKFSIVKDCINIYIQMLSKRLNVETLDTQIYLK